MILLAILLPFGPQLLAVVGASPDIAATALPYLQIRALAAPAVLVTFVLNGLFLAKLETKIPFRVAAIAGVVNLLGDLFLVLPRFYDMGIAGAAWATLASQYLAAGLMWTLARRKAADWGLEVRVRSLLPTWRAVVELTTVGWALISRSLFMMACYTGLTSAATVLGPLSLAAHNVALQAWWFLSTINEPVLLAAQALLTRETRGKGLGAGAGAMDPSAANLARVILQIALLVAVSLTLLTAGVFAGLPWIFSSDVAVQAGVQSIALQGSVAQLLICLVMAGDGITIGFSDWGHLQMTNFSAMASTLLALFVMQRAGLASLGNVWWILALFCLVRLTCHALYYSSKLLGRGTSESSTSGRTGNAADDALPPPMPPHLHSSSDLEGFTSVNETAMASRSEPREQSAQPHEVGILPSDNRLPATSASSTSSSSSAQVPSQPQLQPAVLMYTYSQGQLLRVSKTGSGPGPESDGRGS